MSRRVLFVDDEPHVLQGLEDLLRKQRRRWQMVFVGSGDAALAELARQPFDVIVTDIRMPEMDGVALLERVRDEHPSTMRLALSGHADRDAMVRALTVAQQFLNKPCEGEQLRGAIERACQLRGVLEHEAVRTMVGRLARLPSVPQTYWELVRLATSGDVAIREIAEVVERDPAMSAKVLQLVNSAFFGLAQTMTSVGQAVSYLGLDLIKALALSAHVFAAADHAAEIDGFSLRRLQHDALLVARTGRRLVGDPRRSDEVFTAGVVHDIGEIVLALGAPERFVEVVAAARAAGIPRHHVERERLGVTHAEVGAYLLGSWGLPLPIVAAVAYHHEPGRLDGPSLQAPAALHVASALIDAEREDGARVEERLDLTFLERAGLSGGLGSWQAIAREEGRALAGR